jgi:hypothetical protein
MGREEKDLQKRQKIDRLQLSGEEWARLGLFNDLLGVCGRFLASDFTDLITLIRDS